MNDAAFLDILRVSCGSLCFSSSKALRVGGPRPTEIPPRWLRHGSKMVPKTSNMAQKWPRRIFNWFQNKPCQFGGFGRASREASRRFQDDRRWLKMASKWPQDCSICLQDGTHVSPRLVSGPGGSQDDPKVAQNGLKADRENKLAFEIGIIWGRGERVTVG